MNKRKVLLSCLISLLFLSLGATCVNAADTVGADQLNKGDTFYYTSESVLSAVSKNYSTGLTSEGSMGGTTDILLNLTRVNGTTNEIDAKVTEPGNIASYGYTDIDYIENSSSGNQIIIWDSKDDDNDGLIEGRININVDVDIGTTGIDYDFAWVVAGCWDNFTEQVNPELERELEGAKGNLTGFDYSVTLKDRELSISIEYKREQYDWEAGGLMNGSVIYDYHEWYTAKYDDNLVLTEYKEGVEYEISSVVNKTYLEDNELSINQEYLERTVITRGGGGEEEIPGFELITLLGVSTAVVIGIIYIFKHKRLS